jgi:hypothetical protein
MRKYVYNDELDSIAVNQCGEYEELNGVSLDEPEYKRSELDSRDLEILIDCLEAGSEGYENEGNADALNRIAKMIEVFAE